MQLKRRLKTGSESLLFLTIAIAIIIVVNVLILMLTTKRPMRIDLTHDQLYTLSDTSRKVVTNLPGKVTIYAFITKDLPPPDTDLYTRVGDLLSEYEAYSDGSIEVLLINPDDSEEAEEQAKGYGIEKVPVIGGSQDSAEFRLAYKGICIEYGDEKLVLPVINMSDNLEYELTYRIRKLTMAEDRKVVAFLTGHHELSENEEFQQLFRTELGKQFEIRFVNLGQGDKLYQVVGQPEPIPGEPPLPEPPDAERKWYDALIILGPETPVPVQEQYAIDQFLMRGGSVAFFISPTLPTMQTLQQKIEVGHKLDPMLDHYGVVTDNMIIVDPVNNIQMERMLAENLVEVAPEPLVPMLNIVERSSPIVRDFPVLAFPLAMSVTPKSEAQPGVLEAIWICLLEGELCEPDDWPELQQDDEAVTILAESFPTSVKREPPPFVELLHQEEPPEDAPRGSFVVAFTHFGPLTSYFATRDENGRPQPQGESSPDKIVATEKGRFAAIGSGRLLFLLAQRRETEAQQFGVLNFRLLQNTIDWLIQDTELISIRMKGLPPLMDIKKVPDKKTQAIFRFGNILGPPVFFMLVIGGAFFVWRRFKKKNLKSRFGARDR